MTATIVRRARVTASFLKRPGGYLTDGERLYQVVGVGGPNERKVALEDCWAPPDEFPLTMERTKVLRMRVVAWPPKVE